MTLEPQPEIDEEGYLKNLEDWTTEVAALLAEADSIELTREHWEIINFLRDFHAQYGIIPVMRVLVKQLRESLGPDKGRSIHLLSLFPDNPIKRATRIAGLPKPPHCD